MKTREMHTVHELFKKSDLHSSIHSKSYSLSNSTKMQTFLTIFVVATTLTAILRGSQGRIRKPTHTHTIQPIAPAASSSANNAVYRMTSVDELMIVVGPKREERPYKMLLQMEPSQPNNNNSTEGDMLLMKVLRNTFLVGMRNLSTLTSGADSSKNASANKFMMQLQPEKADNLENDIDLNLLALALEGEVSLQNFVNGDASIRYFSG